MLTAASRVVLTPVKKTFMVLSNLPSSTPELRKILKLRRARLGLRQRTWADTKIQQRVLSLVSSRQTQAIALYLGLGGEVSLTPVLSALWKQGKQVYLPRIQANGNLSFHQHFPFRKLFKNRYGIFEPSMSNPLIAPWRLDVVVTPLVGFDSQCQRLGMGGGFYDRTFAFKQTAPSKGPVLVGVAYELQKVARLNAEPWDVKLDAVVTEKHVYLEESLNIFESG